MPDPLFITYRHTESYINIQIMSLSFTLFVVPHENRDLIFSTVWHSYLYGYVCDASGRSLRLVCKAEAFRNVKKSAVIKYYI